MRAGILSVMLLITGVVVQAHVVVLPRESLAGGIERYTVRVPTEGQVATTAVELEIPAGVTVREAVAGDTYTYETRREGDRIVAITWKQEIPPGQRGEFRFVARNPSSGRLVWKAHQRFADGTSADWVGIEPDRRPASVTTLVTVKSD